MNISDLMFNQLNNECLKTIKTSLYWLDGEGKILYVNDYAVKMHNIPKEELLNMHITDVDPLVSKEDFIIYKDAVVKEPQEFETQHMRRGSKPYPVQVTASFHIVDGKEIIICLVQDLTAIKKTESALAEIKIKEKVQKKLELLNEELEHKVYERTEELEEANEELQTMIYNLKTTQDKLIESEKMASLGSLVAGVAHEINTPVGIGLTGITHFIEESSKLAKDYKDENMTEEAFNSFLTTTDELSQLIKKNLERTVHLVQSFKQVAVDQTNDIKREINLKEYISEVLFSLSNITKKDNIKINLKGDKSLKIKTYPGSLSQIITNLVVNSVRHGFDGNIKGIINIELSHENKKVTLLYKDNGKGIKKDNINKIFDPFFTTNREHGGTGLGLNIIYNIITTTLNGTITCKSEENEGVEFTIKWLCD